MNEFFISSSCLCPCEWSLLGRQKREVGFILTSLFVDFLVLVMRICWRGATSLPFKILVNKISIFKGTGDGLTFEQHAELAHIGMTFKFKYVFQNSAWMDEAV